MSYNMIGGDIGGLAALARQLQSYLGPMMAVVDALNGRVEGLVHEAGWWGDAATAFKRRWEVDARAAEALADVIKVVAGIIDGLSARLSALESILEDAADQARRSGVPVGVDGHPPVLPPNANPAVLQALSVYVSVWQVAMNMARRARMGANRELQSVEAVMLLHLMSGVGHCDQTSTSRLPTTSAASGHCRPLLDESSADKSRHCR